MLRFAVALSLTLSTFLSLATALSLAPPAFAFENENLLVAVPKGYKPDYNAKNARGIITEMVPQGESVKAWTEMLTVQIFFRSKPGPEAFKQRIAQGWIKACKGASAHPIAQGQENGYPFAVWMLACPRNAQTGKPEWTWFKAIQGNDSLYVVQKAFKFEPAREQVIAWTKYLKGVSVCDTRLPERHCPAGVK
jgi:hypothetical protein